MNSIIETKKNSVLLCTLCAWGLTLFFFNAAYSQDCAGRFEANAGPGIDVCEGGSVFLSGIIGGDATVGEWIGGKGTFTPNRNTLEAEYIPTAEEVETSVTLALLASNPKMKCPAERSEIVLVVNSQPKADAGENSHICPGKIFQMQGKIISGKAKKTTWITNGSGKFDDPNKLDALYTPSEKDKADGGCSIMLLAEPFGFCQSDSATMILMIDRLPEFSTASDKNVTGGEAVKLSVKPGEGAAIFSWTSSGTGKFVNAGEQNAVYTPSSEDIKKETVWLELSVTSDPGGCTAKKQVALHFKQNITGN